MAKPKPRAEQSLTVELHVVEYRYHRMFCDRISKRATVELRARDLPENSTLVLWRDGQKLATSEVTFEGYSGHDGEFQEVFHSESYELAEPEAELMRSRNLPIPTGNYARTLKAESLCVGDKLVLTLTSESLKPESKREWPLERWLKEALQKSKKAAYEQLASDAAWVIIDRLCDDVHPRSGLSALLEFRESYLETPWRAALRYAVDRYGIKMPKK